MDLGPLTGTTVVVHIRKAGSKYYCSWAVARAAVCCNPVASMLIGHKAVVVDRRHRVEKVVVGMLEKV